MWEIACPMAGDGVDVKGNGRAEIISAITGWNVTPKELELIAERVYTLERAFIVREGISRIHDVPPWKAFNVPIPRGRLSGMVAQKQTYETLLTNYYRYRGWNPQTGIPTRTKLAQLGLNYVAETLEQGLPYPEWVGPPLWPEEMYPSGGSRAQY
jgi:aldehyde:ferredoxin oxidoreductase